MCAVLTVFAGRASSTFYDSIRSVAGSESEAKTVSVGESELLHSECSHGRTISQRFSRRVVRSAAARPEYRAPGCPVPDHWSFFQTHQFNAIGCPLLC